MEYHEIGEIFEYNRVILGVAKGRDNPHDCEKCYFNSSPCCDLRSTHCNKRKRMDGNPIYYQLIGQCKLKDMEQKTEIERIEEERRKIENNMAGHTPNYANETIMMNDITDKLKYTLVAKNNDYGNAFSEMFDELGIDYAYGKLREKMNRIKVLRKQPNMVENEGLEDALLDTAGYAILTLMELKKRKK